MDGRELRQWKEKKKETRVQEFTLRSQGRRYCPRQAAAASVNAEVGIQAHL